MRREDGERQVVGERRVFCYGLSETGQYYCPDQKFGCDNMGYRRGMVSVKEGRWSEVEDTRDALKGRPYFSLQAYVDACKVEGKIPSPVEFRELRAQWDALKKYEAIA